MSDYHLDGLNWREFEHLVQALSVGEIATGITPFGDGKDGGREATYEGRMQYPSTASPWDGYLVVQCKFRKEPIANTTEKINWVKTQLATESRKYTRKRRALRKPDYFLFATNLRFSAAKGGGKDQLQVVLNEFASRIGAKECAAWTYDEICRFVDRSDAVRKAYLGFITPGDVLATAFEYLDRLRPEFREVIAAFLQKQLLHDRSARLESAGAKAEQQIPLATVFVDLPATTRSELVREDDVENTPRELLVKHIVDACSQRTNRSSKKEVRVQRRGTHANRELASRFVIVGGPGQGKSTLGQYICQLYRAALVRDRVFAQRAELPDVWKSIQLIEAQQEEIGSSLPLVRRFPIRLILNEYASDRAHDQSLTVLKWLQRELTRLGGADCSLADVRLWLKEYPWVIVFDGLDEVPASSNRADVIREMEDFRIDVANLGADAVIVCTTRPQSYAKEFSADVYQHWYLLPLQRAEALGYAKRLVAARYPLPDDPHRNQVVRRLEMACRSDVTQKLMQSPLQVTIMTTLVEHLGEPPRQRYTLFQRYYQTIYDREIGREGKSSAFLSDRKADIDAVHFRVGLLLQRNSEIAGGTNARMTNEQFANLFADYLGEVGYSGKDAQALMSEISVGSFERLVFLTRPTETEVTFELRSLQEYMAAEALFQGPEEFIVKRMQAIAPIAHWRNVMLFAIGKCFQERTHLLPVIHVICSDLNDRASFGSDLASSLNWGSQLALEILEEGVAQTNKKFHRLLCQVAFRVLETPDRSLARRVAHVYHIDLDDLYLDVIEKLLGHTSLSHRVNGWTLCACLAERQCAWALSRIEQDWKLAPLDYIDVLGASAGPELSSWWADKLALVLPQIEPATAEQIFAEANRHIASDMANRPLLGAALKFFNWSDPRGSDGYRRIVESGEVPFLYCRTSAEFAAIGEMAKISSGLPEWRLVLLGLEFLHEPTPKILGQSLRKIVADQDLWSARELGSSWLPWPIAACVNSATTIRQLEEFANLAAKGACGKFDDWKLAEQRWERGLSAREFLIKSEMSQPITAEVLATGVAPFGGEVMLYEEGFIEFQEIADRILTDRASIAARWLAALACDGLFAIRLGQQDRRYLEAVKVAVEIGRSSRSWLSISHFEAEKSLTLSEQWLRFFDWLGRHTLFLLGGSPPRDQLVEEICTRPYERLGLLHLLATTNYNLAPVRIPRAVLLRAKAESNHLPYAAATLLPFCGEAQEEDLIWAGDILLKSRRWTNILAQAMSRPEALTQESHRCYERIVSRMLERLRAGTDGSTEKRGAIVDCAIQVMNARRSGLASEEVWATLQLPAVH